MRTKGIVELTSGQDAGIVAYVHCSDSSGAVVSGQLELVNNDQAQDRRRARGTRPYTSLEICAGAGGAALGVEQAGFRHVALIELELAACATMRVNRPEWNVIEGDLRGFRGWPYVGIDLLSGGVPCPPFSKAGLKLGSDDERDLFPEALRLVEECRPRAVMLENVPGLMETAFASYREQITDRFDKLGYTAQWAILQAADFGVPQLRPRVLCVALKKPLAGWFEWPTSSTDNRITVGQALREMMASDGWEGADEWAAQACRVAPTLVGGSKRHGGPDLGPTRAKKQWAELGVDGHVLANEPPTPGFQGRPRLTVPMAAVIQGFPPDWKFWGKKTATYRQVGNAFPPPVARAVAAQIHKALRVADKTANQNVQARTISHAAGQQIEAIPLPAD